MPFNKFLLVKLRIQQKISQTECAYRCLLEPHTIKGLESGSSKNPYFETVEKIADYFNRPMDDFRDGKIPS